MDLIVSIITIAAVHHPALAARNDRCTTIPVTIIILITSLDALMLVTELSISAVVLAVAPDAHAGRTDQAIATTGWGADTPVDRALRGLASAGC
jgi:hypothetical protein